MSEPVQKLNPLADRTVGMVLGALRDNHTACAAQVVELIREITARPDAVSVHHLAELIERDVAVVAEVIRIANTIGFNPEGVEITTVAQAIQVIGFVKIRNLAVSLLLLQNAGQQASSRESREASVLAVACGYLAEVGVERAGSRDSGHAFVCAALRRYANLLLCTFLGDEHRRAMALARTVPEDRAFVEVFGLTALDLGRRVLEDMRLPSAILETFRGLPGVEERKHMDPERLQLLVATDFAAQVSEWLVTGKGSGSVESMAAAFKERYGDVLELKAADLREIFVDVDRRLTLLRGGQGELPVLDRVRALVTDRSGRRTVLGAPGTAAQAADASRILLDGIAELSELLGAQPVKGLKVFMAAARSMEAALGLIDCWVFRRPTLETTFRPFVGSGLLFPQLPVTSAIDPTRRTVFTVCLDRGEIVLLSRPTDPKIRPFVPDWMIRATGESPLVLLPVGTAGSVTAVLCGVGSPGTLAELSPAVRQQLQVLARLLSLAKDQ